MIHGRAIIYAAAAAALTAAMPARAQTAASERVAFADLDLARGADMRQARARLEAAVQRVCPSGLEHPAALPPEVTLCRTEARRDARAALAERHFARTEPTLVSRQ